MSSFSGPHIPKTKKAKSSGVVLHPCQLLLDRLRAALVDLLRLQSVDETAWARQIIWQRLRLPRDIIETWDEKEADVDLDSTAITFDLDTSALGNSMEAGAEDISLNMTMAAVCYLPPDRHQIRQNCLTTILIDIILE